MKLTKALKKLSKDNVMGVMGTDWSWYYMLGTDIWGDTVIVDEDGNTVRFGYIDIFSEDWILVSHKKLKKKRGEK